MRNNEVSGEARIKWSSYISGIKVSKNDRTKYPNQRVNTEIIGLKL